MDRLHAMRTFVKVVEMNSFSRAADALSMPRASVTTTIKNLEAHLKVSLMHRTTRRLNLTPKGAHYYELCVRILSAIQESEDAMAKNAKGPRGPLRVDMPGSIGRLIIVPRISEFTAQYPHIDLTIGFVDRSAHLAQSTVDCALRSGNLHDSSFVSRELGEVRMVTAASPTYIEQHGMPKHLDDLENHYAVHHYSSITGRIATHNSVVDGTAREIKMKRAILLSDIEACVTCGLAGTGIIQAPRFLLQSHLDEGRLVELLPQSAPLSIPMSAQYAPDQHLSGSVRVFVEWVATLFLECSHIGWTESITSTRSDIQRFSELVPTL